LKIETPATGTTLAVGARPSAVRLNLLFTALVVCWAMGFVATKTAMRGGIPEAVLVGWRAALSFLCTLPVCVWEWRRREAVRWDWADAPMLLVAAISGVTLSRLFYTFSLDRTSVAHSSLVISTMPLLVLIMAVARKQERATASKILGMCVAMGGVALLEWRKGGGSGANAATLLGDFLAFLNAVTFALYSVLSKDLTRRYGAVLVTTLANGIGAVMLLPLAWWAGLPGPVSQITGVAWLSLAYLGVFQGAVAYVIYYYLLGHLPASRVALYSYIQPVAATILAFLMLGETVTFSLASGGALVLAGVWVASRL
jgi:drug/metabolite transporter (DMT)-like permease